MHAHSDELKNIIFITLPPSSAKTINDFTIDPSIEIPVQLSEGSTGFAQTDQISIELIVAGMLKILAWDPSHPHRAYYRAFVLAAQPNAAQELNIAAIAQEQKGNHHFAEELFRAVCVLEPQSASFINLATLYSRIAAQDTKKGEQYDTYQQRSLSTLLEGLELLEEDGDLLREIGYFHLYQGNVEAARSFLERYLETEGEEDEKRTHTRKILADITAKLADDETLMAAYDAIQMNKEEEAITTVEGFLSANPTVWNAWFLKGWALRRLARWEEAQDALLKALSYTTASSDLYNELAICALESGKRELAKQYLDTAIDLDEGNITLLSNLAYLHLADDELDLAREYLERARSVDEDDPLIGELIAHYQAATGEQVGAPVVQEYLDAEDVIRQMDKGEAK
ncbi:MAG: tetratricopeptide repeat protein [Spirochaetales bacterium]|jgi:Flp pilus assembly protein TadD|nr:tetratricopeptide repeat protein [Spirochaetales bacterium]